MSVDHSTRTRRTLVVLGCVLSIGVEGIALAEPIAPPVAAAALPAPVETAPPPAAPLRDEPRPPSTSGRPARRGFQGALRTGFSLPFGDATAAANDSLARRYAWQLPVMLDLGAKVTDSVFVGVYLGAAFGDEGNDMRIEGYCKDDDDDFENDVACSATSFQIGLEGQYSFQPAERWNPWIGYGIGFESSQETIEDRNHGYRETTSSTGYTLAKLGVGIDHRSAIGIGPFAEVALGRFTASRTEVKNVEVHSGTIDQQAFHAWVTFGVRLVVMP